VPEGSGKPSSNGEVLDFVIKSLRMGAEDVGGVGQNPTNDGIIYVKFYKEETMKKTIDCYRSANFKFKNGTIVQVALSEANENIKCVRIFGLSFEVEDREIGIFFQQFGTVTRLVKERYPSQYNFDV
jgi:hypothetical protein